MFNRSWYKNTWLGKKLGLKIDWSKENLVTTDGKTITVIHTFKDYVYSGCVKSISSSSTMVGGVSTTKYVLVETGIFLTEFEIAKKTYSIVYDNTKISALKYIKSIAGEEDEITVTIELGKKDDTFKDYKMCDEFYSKVVEYLIGDVEICTTGRNYYYLKLRCKDEYAGAVRSLAKAYIK